MFLANAMRCYEFGVKDFPGTARVDTNFGSAAKGPDGRLPHVMLRARCRVPSWIGSTMSI